MFKLFRIALVVLSLFAVTAGCRTTESLQEKPPVKKAIPEDVAELIERFSNRDPSVRAYAAQVLGNMGERAVHAIPALIKQLEDKERGYWGFDPVIGDCGSRYPNDEAMKALVKIGSASVKHLTPLLTHENLEVREWAAIALGRIGDPATVEPLITALADRKNNSHYFLEALEKIGKPAAEPLHAYIKREKDTSSLVYAIRSLAEIGDPRSGKLAIDIYHKVKDSDFSGPIFGISGKEYALQALAKALVKYGGRPGAEMVLPLLINRDSLKRGEAKKALRETGGPIVIEVLSEEFARPDSQLRDEVAVILGILGDRRPVKHLLEMTEDKSREKRWAAVAALGKTGAPEAIPILVSCLADSDYNVATSAVQVLYNIGEPAVEPLIKLVNDEDALGRGYAAEILGRLNDRRAVEPLKAALKDYTMLVPAAMALGRMKETGAIDELIFALEHSVGRYDRFLIKDAIRNLGKGVSEKIFAHLQSDDPEIRRVVVEALASIGDTRALEYILKDINSKNEGIQSRAYDSLRDLANSMSVDVLIKWTTDINGPDALREAAVSVLSEMRDAKAADALITALKDDNAGVRWFGIKGLYFLKYPQAARPLAEVLCLPLEWAGSYSGDVASTTLWMLGKRSVEPLIEFLPKTHESARHNAIWALAKLGDKRAVPAIIPLIKDKNRKNKDYAVWALGYLRDPRAVEPLAEALDDLDCCSEAAEALAEIGDRRAVMPLVASLRKRYERFCKIRECEEKGEEYDPPEEDEPDEELVPDLGVDTGEYELVEIMKALGRLGDSRAVNAIMKIFEAECNRNYERDSWDHIEQDEEWKDEPDQDPRYAEVLEEFSYGDWGEEWDMDNDDMEPCPYSCDPHESSIWVSESQSIRNASMQALIKIGAASTEALIDTLKDKNVYLRIHSAHMLGYIRDVRAVKPLATALRDKSEWVRMAASRSLYKLGEASVSELVEAVKDDNWRVRRTAVIALGGIEDKNAIEALTKALKDSNMLVSAHAAKSLLALDRKELEDRHKEKGISSFDEDDPEEFQSCKIALEPLLGLLKDKDPLYRMNAVGALELLRREPQVGETLAGALEDENQSVRDFAALSLGRAGDRRAIKLLIDLMLSDRYHYHLRGAIPGLLVHIGDYSVMETLVQISRWGAGSPETSHLSYQAQEALLELANSASTEQLLDTLTEGSIYAKKYAGEALARRKDGESVVPLIAALKAQDMHTRRWAAFALGKIDDDSAADALVEALGDQQTAVRASAAEALGKLGYQKAADKLLELLNDQDLLERKAAVRSLGQIKEHRAIGQLTEMVKKDEDMKLTAIVALGRIGDPGAVEIISETLTDSRLREYSIEALGNIGDRKAIEALVTVIKPEYDWYPGRHWSSATAILIAKGEKAVETLTKALEDNPKDNIKIAAIQILSEIRDKRAVEPIAAALKDKSDDVREYAAKGLGIMRYKQAVQPLIEALGDKDNKVRNNAYNALCAITGMGHALSSSQAKWKQWYEENRGK